MATLVESLRPPLTIALSTKGSPVDSKSSDTADTTAAAGSTWRRCHLLALPAEVRVEIYRHLFNAAQISAEQLYPLCAAELCSCDFPWQLTNTCRRLRHEATPYLLSTTILQICGTIQKVSRLSSSLTSTIQHVVILNTKIFCKQPFSLDIFASLKVLELHNITVWCKYHDETYLQSADADDCMIQLALFNLNRISPQLKRMCSALEMSFKILLWCQYVVASSTQESIVCMRVRPEVQLLTCF